MLAAERLIQGNLQLVVAIARRYLASGWPILDLVQEGNVGLVQAVEGFDPDRGLAFRTFAMWWIRHAIATALDEHGAPPPGPIDELQVVWDRFVAAEGRQPTVADLATGLAVTEDRVRELLGTPPPPPAEPPAGPTA